MRQGRSRSVALVAALSVLLVACPADDPVVEDPDAATDTVTISGATFEPGTYEVEAGTTITFVNEDAASHTVTAGTPDAETGEFHEELPGQGDSAQITFGEPGSFPYFCRLHRSMTATIEVGSG